MQFLYGLDVERMFPLQKFKKSDAKGPDIKSSPIDYLLFIKVNDQLRRSVPFGAYELVGDFDIAI